MNITPFSAYITIRSSFTKNVGHSAVSKTFTQTQSVENHPQKEETKLLEKLEVLEKTNINSTNTIKVLEEKISKADQR